MPTAMIAVFPTAGPISRGGPCPRPGSRSWAARLPLRRWRRIRPCSLPHGGDARARRTGCAAGEGFTSAAGVITGTNANTNDACLAIAAELSAATAWSSLGARVLDEPSHDAATPSSPGRSGLRATSAPVVDTSPVTMPATVIDERVAPGASASGRGLGERHAGDTGGRP